MSGPGRPGGPQGPPGPGGPGAPGGPGGPGAPGGPTGGQPSGGPWPYGQGDTAVQAVPAQPPRRRRTMPVWGVLLALLLVAVVSAGVGGVAGGYFGAQNSAADQSSPRLNNQLPSDVPSRAPDTIAGVAQRVSPSVVSIQAKGRSNSGNGSGFIIEGDHVVTNNHVVSALEDGGLEIAYSNGETSGAEVVGTAPDSDLAVLKVSDPVKVEPLEFGDSTKVTVGDEVIAIGAPLGLAGTVTTGIISAKERPVTLGERGQETFINALQTDAAINPGNSGGPLVDAKGRVIGVNSAIATMGGGMSGQQSGSIGLGFAIPSAQAEEVVNKLLNGGEAPRPEIGAVLDMRYQDTGARIASDKDAGGEAIKPDSPAEKAGLKPGDVIVEFDGEKVDSADDLLSLIGEKEPKDTVKLTYDRDGEEKTVEITLGAKN